MKKFISSIILALVIIGVPASTLAAQFRVSQEQNGTAEVSKTETVKNLYTAGNTVNVSGTTEGDLTAGGNALNLSGSVENNLLAAGSNININGKVGKNVHLAGSNISLNNLIGGDLFAAAAMVNLNKEATVGGDFFAGVGTLNMDGAISGRARIAGGDVVINGKIDGDLDIDANKLTIGDNAVIGGKLTYRSPQEAAISKSAIIKGAVDFKKTETNSYGKKFSAGVLGVFGFFGIIMSLALLFVLIYLLPKSSRSLVANTFTSFWANLGWGFLTFAVLPTALFMLAITMIGLKIAGVLALLYLVYLILSFSYATVAIGSQILKWIEKEAYRVDWASILVGVLAVAILGLIPFLGGLIIFIVALAVLGQSVVSTGAFLKSQQK